MLSCGCSFDGGTRTVGDPRQVTCRKPRQCGACCADIGQLDQMYMWSMFDFDFGKTVAPMFLCEECGDMACNLIELGFCFDFSESLRSQWLEYAYDNGLLEGETP